MASLTDKQRRVLDFIQGYTLAKGYPPTLREVGDALGVVKSAAHYHVSNLEHKGFIERERRRFRTLKVVKYD